MFWIFNNVNNLVETQWDNMFIFLSTKGKIKITSKSNVTHSAATQLCIPYKEVEIQALFLKIQSYSHTVLSLVFTHMVT